MAYKVAVLAANADDPRAAELAGVLKQGEHLAGIVAADETFAAVLGSTKPQVALGVSSAAMCSGELQSVASALGVPVAGSSQAVARRAGRKDSVAEVMAKYYAGFDGCASPVAGFSLSKAAYFGLGASAVLERLVDGIPGGFPLVVKAATSGFGIGAVRVDSPEGLKAALEAVFQVCGEAMVQEWVEGVKLSVAVLGSADDPYALPPVEIAPVGDGQADLFAPVRLESLSQDESMAQAVRSEVERAAAEVFAAFGCDDYASVDIIWDGARAKVIQLDTCPDLGASSLFGKACQVAGIGTQALLEELMAQAMYRG